MECICMKINDRYLFKAIDTNSVWRTGLLIALKGNRCAIEESDGSKWACDAKTLCQCTGQKDKNGKLIWENDIVRFKHEKFDFKDELEPFERTCLPNKKEYKRNYVVEFCNTPTHYGLRFRNGSIWFMVHKMTVVMHDTEVIGNIFGNPELLESEE